MLAPLNPKSMARECATCGAPVRVVFRPQGGGRPCDYCSIECVNARKRLNVNKWRATAYGQYITQRDNANRRNVEWQFTFEQWLDWWGADLDKRGRKANSLCMARKNDIGPYSSGNCVKRTKVENVQEWHAASKAGIALLHTEPRSESVYVVGILGFGC